MATKSFLMSISITNPAKIKKLVETLEYAEQHRGTTEKFSMPVVDVPKENICNVLSNYKFD